MGNDAATACRIGIGIMLVVAWRAMPAAGDEPPPAVALVGTAPTSQPGSTDSPTSQPAERPSEQFSAWPPGLVMRGLGAVHARKPLDDLGISIWGFAETGFTGDLTNGDRTLFGRAFDARRVNNLRLNQLRLTAQRDYDASRAVDWGFRVDGMFGGDALLTHTPGLFYHAGEGTGDAWADIPQMYAQGWFKTGAESGLEATFGKFACPMTAESIDATSNQLYSHSYLYGFATPFTHTGARLNYLFNKQMSAYFGVVEGWDVFHDNNDAPSYIAGGSLSSATQVGGHARDQLGFNFITGPEQPGNSGHYRTVVDSTWTHWWTDKFSTALNGDFGMEQRVPGVGQANWYGFAHYATYAFDDRVSATWRTEWFADDTGSRIGRAGNYTENTFGLNLTPWPKNGFLRNVTLRPEIRWDHSDQPAFGGQHDQMTIAIDLIFKF